jgi:hypothetical protein
MIFIHVLPSELSLPLSLSLSHTHTRMHFSHRTMFGVTDNSYFIKIEQSRQFIRPNSTRITQIDLLSD